MKRIDQPIDHLYAELAAARKALYEAKETIAKLQGEREAATATILALTIALQAATVQHAQAQQPALHLGGDVLGRFCWN